MNLTSEDCAERPLLLARTPRRNGADAGSRLQDRHDLAIPNMGKRVGPAPATRRFHLATAGVLHSGIVGGFTPESARAQLGRLQPLTSEVSWGGSRDTSP
jgi:hypothetical protein